MRHQLLPRSSSARDGGRKSCAISPDCDHLSSSDNVVAWSGVQWDDVTCGVTVLCNSRTFARSSVSFSWTRKVVARAGGGGGGSREVSRCVERSYKLHWCGKERKREKKKEQEQGNFYV